MQSAIVAVDGCGGAGKTTFVTLLSGLLHDCPMIHTDDFASWDNPFDWYPRFLEQVLQPLRSNLQARYQRLDWSTSKLSEWHTLSPQQFVIVEGVSASREEFRRFLAFSIYVQTDRQTQTRLMRGLKRDGEDTEDRWQAWIRDEDDYVERDDPAKFADLTISGNPKSNYDPRNEVVVLVPARV